MDDRGPDDIDANYDPYMEAISVSPTMLSLEAAAFMGMCATVVIGNSLVCVLGNRKAGVLSNFNNAVLLHVTVLNAFTALLTMPLMTAAILEGRWRYGDGLCRGTGTLTFVFIVMALFSVFMVFVKRSCSLMCYKHDDSINNTRWFFLVMVFVTVSLLSLARLFDWKALLKNPTRLLCRMANSPARVSYRLFYGVYSVLLCIMVIILFTQPKRQTERFQGSSPH